MYVFIFTLYNTHTYILKPTQSRKDVIQDPFFTFLNTKLTHILNNWKSNKKCNKYCYLDEKCGQ